MPLESTWTVRSPFLNSPRMTHLEGRWTEPGYPRDGIKLCEHLPVMGSRFNSRARSFEASCHSLVMVFGSGPASTAVSTVGKKTGRVLSGPTEESGCEGQSTSGHDTGHDKHDELRHTARRVEVSPGSVRSKGDVVSCIYRYRVSHNYSGRAGTTRGGAG